MDNNKTVVNRNYRMNWGAIAKLLSIELETEMLETFPVMRHAIRLCNTYAYVELEKLIDLFSKIDIKIISTNLPYYDEDEIPKSAKRLIFTTGSKDMLILVHGFNQENYSLKVNIFTQTYEELNRVETLINEKILSKFAPVDECASIELSWFSKTSQGVVGTELTELLNDKFYPEAYENENISDDIKAFLNSDESILVLTGKAGTGKSRLTRRILHEGTKMKLFSHMAYTMDHNVLNDESFFIKFIESRMEVMVLEDLDELLIARIDGNNAMTKLLNLSDGILSPFRKKKIIITTNIQKMDKIDSALLRVGRCFGVWKFKDLTPGRATQLLHKLADSDEEISKKMTTAEVFSYAKGFDLFEPVKRSGFSGGDHDRTRRSRIRKSSIQDIIDSSNGFRYTGL
tara:strand:+ start:5929 stop:7131 length:1203 start_codon:yes stop_codon:yes gene_type:complete